MATISFASHQWALDAAIVDLDGTMVDTIGDFSEAITRMLSDLQLPLLTAADIEHMVGKGTEHLLRLALAAALTSAGHPKDGLAEAVETLFPQAMQRYMHHYVAINGLHSSVYDGVALGLQALKNAGLRLACVTNKPLAFTTPLLKTKGLDGLFEVVFGGDSFERKKPDPLPLLNACQALGASPARTLMIGDSSNDAQAGRAAGCPVVLVSYGYNHGQPVDTVDADGFVDSIAQLRVL
ncbi:MULTISPECIES: phosphoglycolate phosphatase [unclassified Comamonas]|uniref:phosphoglycolate phosphatase n=1 Tax=unclassified Comamonas TaxID=2638500 RepID=UPI00177D4739|nr:MULTISPECIES: phosphoglycolate phosphatase [unclassified Comamonas]MBD9400282.1 phosphoglycolate phosphatase [Comamonas sp. CMM02]